MYRGTPCHMATTHAACCTKQSKLHFFTHCGGGCFERTLYALPLAWSLPMRYVRHGDVRTVCIQVVETTSSARVHPPATCDVRSIPGQPAHARKPLQTLHGPCRRMPVHACVRSPSSSLLFPTLARPLRRVCHRLCPALHVCLPVLRIVRRRLSTVPGCPILCLVARPVRTQ